MFWKLPLSLGSKKYSATSVSHAKASEKLDLIQSNQMLLIWYSSFALRNKIVLYFVAQGIF